MSCLSNKEFGTPFNANPSVVAHAAILFDVKTKNKPISIETIELDARTGLGNPLNVDIYATDQPVKQAFSESTAWSLVARTILVENPDNHGDGVILPAWDFTPVTVQAGRTKGFYIRMKGPYIDNTIKKNFKGGDEAANGQYLSVDAGYHLDQGSAVFPSTLGTGTDGAPIFAGKFHYTVAESCAQQTLITTEMEYAIIVDTGIHNDKLKKIEEATYAKVHDLLVVDTELKNYVSKDGLKVRSGGVTAAIRSFVGRCPWSKCDAIVTTVQLDHDEDRPGGHIKDRLYRYYKSISQEQLQVLPSGVQAGYVGLVNTRAEFRLTIEGVTTNKEEMDAAQLSFLSEQVVNFLSKKMLQERAQAFNANIDAQMVKATNIIEVEGSVTGAVIATDSAESFANRIENSFVQYEKDFLSLLKFNMNFPGPISKEDRYKYFLGASDASIVVAADNLTRPPTPAPTSEEDLLNKGVTLALETTGDLDSGVIIGVGISLGLLVAMAFTWCACRHIKKERKKRAEKEKRREERRLRAELRRNGGKPGEDSPPTQISVEGQEDPEKKEQDPEQALNKQSSRRGFLRRLGNNESTNSSEKFKDEDSSSSTSSEGFNESSLLRSKQNHKTGEDDLINSFSIPGHHRNACADFGTEDDPDQDPYNEDPHQSPGFDPFTGQEDPGQGLASNMGPQSMGFDPFEGDERSFQPSSDLPSSDLPSSDLPSSTEDMNSPPLVIFGGDQSQGRRHSTGMKNKQSKQKMRSSVGVESIPKPKSKGAVSRCYSHSATSSEFETTPNTSQRAMDKVRDLEMQALFDSSSPDGRDLEDRKDLEDGQPSENAKEADDVLWDLQEASDDEEEQADQTENSSSLHDSAHHSSSLHDSTHSKKKKKKKKKKKEREKKKSRSNSLTNGTGTDMEN